MKNLEIKVAIQVARPVEETFEAIVDPGRMKNYFISEGSGRMEERKEVHWQFPEFDEKFLVRVGEVQPPGFISFTWGKEKEETKVEISLKPADNASTVVTVVEAGKEMDDAGIAWLKGNTEGWANFLSCLKAYLEYGINLRKGAFEFMRKK